MATSGDTTYNLVANEIVAEAFDLCGVGSEGEAISADMTDRAMRSLNLLVKTWGALSHLWTTTRLSVPLVASTVSYVLTPKPMRILSVRRRLSSIDTPLNELAAQDYDEMPNKTAESIPVSFYYDPQSATGTLYVWPAPSTATAASTTLQVTYLRRMEDFDATNDDADLPQEWLQALAYALAGELALKYAVAPDLRREITNRASALFAVLKSWDEEPASLFLSV